MLRAHGISDPGTTRKINEDSLFSDESLGLFVVADGMGGHAAGEVASQLAIEAMGFVRRSHADRDFSWTVGVDAISATTAIASAPQSPGEAHLAGGGVARRLHRHGRHHRRALVAGRRLSIGSVGDSGLYLWSDSTLTLFAEDDSSVDMLRAQNAGINAACRPHPMRSVLTSVLARGRNSRHVGDAIWRRRRPAAVSDGLRGPFPRTMAAFAAAGDLREAARGLVQEALIGAVATTSRCCS